MSSKSKNPELYIFKCSKCELSSVSLIKEPHHSWLILEGHKEHPCYFCSMICMFLYLGEHSFGLQQMSRAVERIINARYFRKTEISKAVQVDSR